MTVEAAIRALGRELDRLSGSGRGMDLWWRDDDAIRATPELDRLLALSRGARLPLALAAIPNGIEPSLAGRLAGRDDVCVLVHGWSHANHAPPGEKTAEFGPHRPAADLAREARAGLESVTDAFGARALPVFVPPWNRVDPAFAASLPSLGFRALSAAGRARIERGPDGFARIDTHLDPVAWREGNGLAGPEALGAGLRRALDEGAGAIGLLTHHLAFGAVHWAFLEAFLDLAIHHPAVRARQLSDLTSGTGAAPNPFRRGRPAPRPAAPARAEADA